MKTNYVLIDYENVQVRSLSLLKGDHFGIVVADLLKRKTSKPGTEKTLLSTIHATCGKNLPQSHIESVLRKLIDLGYVTCREGKVQYALPETAAWKQK